MMNFEEQIGNSFVWWFGQVEDLADPLKLGRARVRVFDWYGENIETADLPWAQPINPIDNASKDGIGKSPTGLEVGSWIFGFFLDGQKAQRPVMMGTIGGIPSTEPDTDRLARNDPEFPPPVIATKNNSRTTAIPTALGGTWDEPLSAYAASYPNNTVDKSTSGHIKEVDDTPSNERIHEYHKAGTFYEIDKDGNKVTRIIGNNYEVVAGSEYVNIKGSCNITIDSNCKTYIKGNWDIQVDGNKTESVGGNNLTVVNGTDTTEVDGNFSVAAARIDLNE